MSKLYQGPTLTRLLLRSLRRWGDRPLFSGHGPTLTYKQALDLVGRYQALMSAHGVRCGQRVAVLTSNRADAWLAGMAAQALGLCMTPLHPLGSLEDHRFILEGFGIQAENSDGLNPDCSDKSRSRTHRDHHLLTVMIVGPKAGFIASLNRKDDPNHSGNFHSGSPATLQVARLDKNPSLGAGNRRHDSGLWPGASVERSDRAA